MHICFVAPINFFYLSSKDPFNKKSRYLTEARQFHSALVFAEQEWTKSFTTGGFAYVGQADNDD